jgi:hypothetical protein
LPGDKDAQSEEPGVRALFVTGVGPQMGSATAGFAAREGPAPRGRNPLSDRASIIPGQITQIQITGEPA